MKFGQDSYLSKFKIRVGVGGETRETVIESTFSSAESGLYSDFNEVDSEGELRQGVERPYRTLGKVNESIYIDEQNSSQRQKTH